MSDGFSSSMFNASKTGTRSAGDGGPIAGATPDGTIKDVTTASFAADVIQASRSQVVLVDFWAPWCGPCKQLTPILEKVVKSAGGRVRLAKMNIDEHPSVAGQLGVRSIPAVFAFVNGRPVDGFMGALPESEVNAFVERLLGGAGGDEGDPIGEAVEEGKRRLAAGDAPGAAQLFAAVLQEEPEHTGAIVGLAECYLELGDTEQAEALFAGIPANKRSDPVVVALQAKLKLAADVAVLGDPDALRQQLIADANDHQARFDLALIAQARNERDEAADGLLDIMRRDRSWGEDAARRKLLEFFDIWGAMDPATKTARRKLSAILFS